MTRRFAALALTVLIAVLCPASASADDTDPDAATVFRTQALDFVHRDAVAAAGSDARAKPLTTADRLGKSFRVRQWSSDFVAGKPSSAVTTNPEVWIAPVLDGPKPVGTVTVARQGSTANPVALDSDAELATALLTLRPGDKLVQDATIGAWFEVRGQTVTPLNQHARAELTAPATIDRYRPIVAARIAKQQQANKDIPVPVGGSAVDEPTSAWSTGAPLAIGALAIVGIGFAAGRFARNGSAKQV